jgi:Lon protease-like protein
MIIPIFPLQLVTFPDEELSLHIFEPRYIGLINELLLNELLVFGIIPIINRKVAKTGTTTKVKKLVNQYLDGRMDIICQGIAVFRVNRFMLSSDSAQAHQADITIVNDEAEAALIGAAEPSYTQSEKLIFLYHQFHQLIRSEKIPSIDQSKKLSFQMAHTSGLELGQQYQLLETVGERNRVEKLIQHFEKVIPILENIEKTREIIRMNGDFRKISGNDFEMM